MIVSDKSTISAAIQAINENGARGIFICDEDQELVGILMDSDIRRAILKNLNINSSVKTIMKTTPFVIPSHMATEKQKKLFLQSEKILAPIVNENRQVVDYLKLSDVLDDVIIPDNGEEKGILPPQRVLIIGGAGYIGSMLTDKLLRMGYTVRVLDMLLYGKDVLKHFTDPRFDFLRGDCRDRQTVNDAMEGVDAVVHLGEVVGDPACNVDETFTIETNFTGTQMIVEQCVKRGIKRFVFASSCSVYGQNDEETNEESALNPVSLYARCKIEAERAILSFDYPHFSATILRLATVHGRSLRQRFDLVVNLLAIKALKESQIQIFGGTQWRPFISVLDVCRGIVSVLQAETRKVRSQIFNLGDSRENYRLKQVAGIIEDIVPGVRVEFVDGSRDNRNYRVNFDKIRNRLGFSAEYTIRDSVRDILSADRNENRYTDYRESRYYNVLTLREENPGHYPANQVRER